MAEIYLSVIIPARNEEDRIVATLRDIDAYLGKQNYAYEIIVVANDCTDNTLSVVDELKKTSVEHLVVLDLGIGFPGKGFAVKEGVKYASGKYILFMDADNATKINEIEKLLPYLEKNYQVVIGSRHTKGAKIVIPQPFTRRVLGRVANILIQAVLLPGIADTQCGFKAFEKSAAKKIFELSQIGGWGFDMELLALARRLGYKIKGVGIIWHEAGKSTLKTGKAARDTLKELFRIKLNIMRNKYEIK